MRKILLVLFLLFILSPLAFSAPGAVRCGKLLDPISHDSYSTSNRSKLPRGDLGIRAQFSGVCLWVNLAA